MYKVSEMRNRYHMIINKELIFDEREIKSWKSSLSKFAVRIPNKFF